MSCTLPNDGHCAGLARNFLMMAFGHRVATRSTKRASNVFWPILSTVASSSGKARSTKGLIRHSFHISSLRRHSNIWTRNDTWNAKGHPELNELRFSTDPVALDVLSVQEIYRQRGQSLSITGQRTNRLDLYYNAALLELGSADPRRIDLQYLSPAAR